MRSRHVFLALCLVPMGIATAQSVNARWPLDSGSRVRIHSPIFTDNTQQGTVMRTEADTLRFRPWRVTASTGVGLRDITGIDVYQGTHSRKTKGALIGFILGGGIAAGIAAATWKPSASFDFGRGGDAAFAGLFGGLGGGLVGFLVGAHETDTWVPVKLPTVDRFTSNAAYLSPRLR
jgi:hypothetical protein